jgi:dTDP-glucose 4,6-dehydratase/UDP-glucuronate decarboxylase
VIATGVGNAFHAAANSAAERLTPVRGATIHVNGASGFLAANLIALIHQANVAGGLGIDLHASARRPLEAVPLFRFLGIRPDVRWEISPAESSTLPANEGAIAIHTASFGAPRDYMREPLATFGANTGGLVRLFDEADRVHAGHVVYFSSAEVYGQATAIPTPEDYAGAPDLSSPRSIYAESKRMAEVLGAVLSHDRGIPFTAVRPWNLYGPGQRLDDGRVPIEFMRQALSGRAVTLASDGTPRRCPCFVWDGLLQVIDCLAPAAEPRAFNVGNPGEEVTMLELARACAAAAGLPDTAVGFDAAVRAGGLARCVPDVSRVTALAPGHHDLTPLAGGLPVLRDWVEWSLRGA